MKVRTVGYYKETQHGFGASESIMDYLHKESEIRIDDICNYLESGIEFIVSLGIVEDVVKPEKGMAGTPSTFTDGEWFWPGDLAYYVRNYKLKLPDEFIETMIRNNWEVNCTLDDLDYEEIEVNGVKIFENE